MYRLLIVEDEDIIRLGIKKIIQEMGLRLSEILEASSGSEALLLAKNDPVDIIITDIKMDNGDGLELIRKLTETKSNTKFIILSGYGQFALAQQAISMGVSEYLLKPIKKKNLFDALTKLIAQLDATKPLASVESTHTSSVYNHRYLFAVCLPLADYKPQVDKKSEKVVHPESLSAHLYSHNRSDSGYVEMIIGIATATMTGNRQLYQLVVNLLTQQGLLKNQTPTIGISPYSEESELLPRLIEQSSYALDFRLLRPSIRHFSFKEIASSNSPFMNSNVFTQSIRSALHERNLQPLLQAVEDWFRFNLQQPDITPSFIIETLYSLLVFSEFNSEKENEWNWQTHNDLIRMYRGSDSFEQFKDRVKDRFAQIQRATARNRPIDSNAISFIVKYLERHYDQNITLSSAAEQIFMNPSYFSTLFKKKTGINFVHYLQKLRIEKSKDLLLHSQLKIYEVATQCGFTDEKYFFKVFKNLTGLTPNEYRDKSDYQ